MLWLYVCILYFITYYLMYITSCLLIVPCLCIARQLLLLFLYMYHTCNILTSLSYTMRGRPFVVVELWFTLMLPLTTSLLLGYHLPCYYFRPVSCMLPLVRPLVMPWLTRTSIILLTWLVACWVSPSCHAIISHPAWYTWLYDYYVYGILSCFMELSATP